MKNPLELNKLFLLITTSILAISLLSVKALSAQDEVTINVTILTVARIEVTPDTITWESVEPGTSSNSPQLVDIKNIGSLNVSQIYAYVDTLQDESQRPYGNTNSSYYAAGGLIVFRNSTNNKFFFAGRIEWNWTSDISNMIKTNVNSPVAWGFFKNTSYEYVWLIGNGTPPSNDPGGIYCNGTGTQFAIEDDVDDGTPSTREPTTTSITRDGGDASWSYFSVNREGAPIYQSCVAVSTDCKKIYIYKYDKRSGFSTCANSRFIQEGNLAPSDPPHVLTLDVYAPYGIPDGILNISTFTVVASG